MFGTPDQTSCSSSVHHQSIISSSSVLHQLFISSSSALHQLFISSSSALHQFFISSSSVLHQFVINSSLVLHLSFIFCKFGVLYNSRCYIHLGLVYSGLTCTSDDADEGQGFPCMIKDLVEVLNAAFDFSILSNLFGEFIFCCLFLSRPG